jgi:LPS export ABC transporter protein LptC
MNCKKLMRLFKTMTLIIAASLFLISCKNNLNEIRKSKISEFNPVGEASDFNLKYTDSGKIKAILISPQMLDFSNLEFPFTEFPKGINLTVFDDRQNKSFITSDYAVSYSGSNIIDLSGNVTIKTHDGKILETQQLYYDQMNEWFFTQKPYKFLNNGTVINGTGIDFSKDFKTLDTQGITGVYGI